MKENIEFKLKSVQILSLVGMCILWSILTLFHYHQAQYLTTGLFPSDLISHIYFGLGGTNTSYSFVYSIFGFLYDLAGSPIYVAMLLSLVEVLVLFVTYKLLQFLFPKGNEIRHILLSVALFFVTPIYLFMINPYPHIGFVSPSVWHNSTYSFMKLFGLLIVFVYMKIERRYDRLFTVKDWFLLSFLFIVINSVKPNFIVTFAPVVFVYMCIDLFTKRITLQKFLSVASTLLPSFFLLVIQYMILYTNDQGGNEIRFVFFDPIYYYNAHPFLGLFQSFAFPIFVYLTYYKYVHKMTHRIFYMALAGLLPYFFLIEYGPRQYHMNFIWGSHFFLFLFFVATASEVYRYFKEHGHTIRIERIRFIVASGLFILHVVSGLYYFVLVNLGYSYF